MDTCKKHLPSELRLEASEVSLVTLSSLTEAGIRVRSSRAIEELLVAPEKRFFVTGEEVCKLNEVVAVLFLRLVEKRLTNDVLCLNL